MGEKFKTGISLFFFLLGFYEVVLKSKDMKFDELVFLDTETTGLGPEDRLCQCAYIYRDKEYNELFKPPVTISVEAMAVSHVTNKHVADKPDFVGSEMEAHLKELFGKDESIIVAHNARFDMDILVRDGVTVERFIDTKKVAQSLDTEGVIPSYAMQYLRYYLELNVEGAQAHDALGDVLVLKALFERLYSKLDKDGKTHVEIIEWMEQVSKQPNFVHTFAFGKYKGQKVAEVAKQDRGYLQWLQGQKQEQLAKAEIREDDDWLYTLEKVLG